MKIALKTLHDSGIKLSKGVTADFFGSWPNEERFTPIELKNAAITLLEALIVRSSMTGSRIPK